MATLPIRSSNLPDFTLSESFETWLDSLSRLAKSKEMDSFLHSSNEVAVSAAHTSFDVARNVGGIMVKTALLPVTLPLHVTASATDLVFSKCSNVMHHVYNNCVPIVINQTFNMPKNRLITTTNRETLDTRGNTPLSRIKKIPNSTTNGRNHSDHDEFLNRLRLDLHSNSRGSVCMNAANHDGSKDAVSDAVYSVDTDSLAMQTINTKFSILLLRVDDIRVNMQSKSPSQSEVRALCVDLHKDFSDEQLVSDALTKLAQRAIDIESSNETVLDMFPVVNREKATKDRQIHVEWNPLGQTKKDCKRLSKLSEKEFYNALCSRVLTWSGKYLGKKYHGSENPFFFARGVVNGTPLDVLNLLWDSKRVNEYNKHCVKREDKVSVIKVKKVKANGFFGAKIIESETKIPLTKMSVRLSALMCAKLLGNRPEDGYVIFSRSLSCGEAGNHPINSSKLCQSGNNEVIMGINIMRSVPGRPDLSDLISISQVDASILPGFLKSRVGIMAAEDFFKNARATLK